MDGLVEVRAPQEVREQPAEARAEGELARRIASGDGEAWEAFFSRFAEWAYRFAYRHLNGQRAEAEDLCSDIMLAAARSLRTFDSRRGTLDIWMLTLARRRLSRFCRKRRRDVPLVPDVLDAFEEGASLVPLSDAALTRDAVNRALASLPERQAAVLTGKYLAGRSVEELARLHNTTPKAVESLLSRARAAFRGAYVALAEDREGGESHG